MNLDAETIIKYECPLSHNVDDWLDNHMVTNAVWCATLSNGENVIEDDGRPNLSTVALASAWERLRLYCRLKNLHINAMKIKFRTNERHLEIGDDGVFFCKSVLGGISGKNVFSYLTGRVDGDILKVVKWRVPDLEQVAFINDAMVDYRDPANYEDCIIRKP